MNISLVILCGGIASRFGGKIKQLAKIGPNGETLLEYTFKQATIDNFKKIILIVNEAVVDSYKQVFGDKYNNIPIIYCIQNYDKTKRQRPWGTADAISCIINDVDDYFVLCNGDDIYGPTAFKLAYGVLVGTKENCNICYKLSSVLPKEGLVNRGICQVDENSKIINITEKLNIDPKTIDEETGNQLASVNFLCLTKKVLQKIVDLNEAFKKEHSDDPKVEHFLPTVLNYLIEKKELTLYCLVSTDQWHGITNEQDAIEVAKQLSG